MNHFSYEQWTQYVKNEVDEKVRTRFDDHLYSCDQCLEVYLQVVANESDELPILVNEDEFTNIVMSKVANKTTKAIPFYQKTVFHYAIAVAMTILLMSSGVFQSITKYVDNVQSPSLQQVTPSVTEEFVNKAFAWMDTFDIKNKEAKK